MNLSEIHQLEVAEEYPHAIDVLEERLQTHPHEAETIIRLGFNLWYVVVECQRMGLNLPVRQYAKRFMALLKQYESELQDNADFCWAYGLGLSLFWFDFPEAAEPDGQRLLNRAASLDPVWKHVYMGNASQEELHQRFAGRGILASYYNIVEQSNSGDSLKAAPDS